MNPSPKPEPHFALPHLRMANGRTTIDLAAQPVLHGLSNHRIAVFPQLLGCRRESLSCLIVEVNIEVHDRSPSHVVMFIRNRSNIGDLGSAAGPDDEKAPSTKNAEAAFRLAQHGAVNVFYWVDGAFGYSLSADVDRSVLPSVSTEVYWQLGGAERAQAKALEAYFDEDGMNPCSACSSAAGPARPRVAVPHGPACASKVGLQPCSQLHRKPR